MWARSDEGTQVWTAEQIHDRAGIQAGERKGKIKGLVPLALSGFNAKLRSILTSCRGVGVNLIGKLYSFNGSLEKLWGGGGSNFPCKNDFCSVKTLERILFSLDEIVWKVTTGNFLLGHTRYAN